jgi:D-galactose 1-dehydrogenase
MLIELLRRTGLVAILRGVRSTEVAEIGAALFAAGFRIIEVPLGSPSALASIAILRAALPAECLIGAGTVLSRAQVDDVRRAGGQLIVMPHADVEVIRAARAAQLHVAPGVATPTEAFAALAAGAEVLKLFPAEILGPAVVKAWRAVLPSSALLMPVGGITPDKLAGFLAAGATGFGLGSALYAPGAPASDVAARAAAFVDAWRAATQAGNDAVSSPIRIGIVGLGQIARDQHIPTLAADPRFQLVAAATTAGTAPDGTPVHATLGAMIAATPELEAVALCTPPQARYALAREALGHGLHVLLEKPPGVTVGEVEELVARARACQRALFAAWHSRAAAAVDAARAWLAHRAVRKAVVVWKEDVRKWHPGQQWIWQPGGLGVFDPGINALSILTSLIPSRLFVTRAVLYVPVNCQTPIAATLALRDGAGAPIEVELDFRQSGEEQWDIHIETDAGQLALRGGGARLEIDGAAVAVPAAPEYPRLYDRFAELVRARSIDVDLAPLALVADALLIGQRVEVEPFNE